MDVRPLDDVFWYPQGDVNNEGCPAKVYANDGRGGLKLAILLPGVERVKWLTGVRNVEDPVLQERPSIKINTGAWESRAQYEDRMAEAELQREVSRKEAERLKIEEFARRQSLLKGQKEKKPEKATA